MDLMKLKAPHGNKLHCKSWQTEAPFRMLLNNLDAKEGKNLLIVDQTCDEKIQTL